MKQIFLCAILALSVVACNKKEEMTESTSAAMKVYKEYAGCQDLTVALTGNYEKAGETYNAVMLQALTDESWNRLLKRYGKEALGNGNVSTLEITDLHTNAPLEDLEEILALMADSIVSATGSETCSFTVSKTYKDGSIIDENLVMGENVDTNEIRHLVHDALSHPSVGYVTYIESNEHIVWLFFYDSEESYEAIMNHVIY